MTRAGAALLAVLLLSLPAAAQNTTDGVAITVTPPPAPAPLAPTAHPRCSVSITAEPPDTTGGWTMQLRDGTANLASADATAPYARDVVLNAGIHSITARWTKTGQSARVSDALIIPCP